MIDQAVDRRIQRTRRVLQQALDKLLEKRDLSDLSVQDIANEAAVNRATFYDHYPDKFALLKCMVGCRFQELLAERKVNFEHNCRSELRDLVRAVCDYVTRVRQLEPPMESAIISALREMLVAGIKQHAPRGTNTPEIPAAAASWAIYGAAREWAQAPNRCPAEEIADIVTTLVSPMLRISGEE
jgi:AcrR family transcriptional regulator